MVDVVGLSQDLFAVLVCTQVLIALSFLFFIIYCISNGSMEAHAMLGVIGYHVFWATGLLWYYNLYPYLTIVLFFAGMVFAGTGTGMALMEHGCKNDIHSWFGILSFVFGVLILILGSILTLTIDMLTTHYLFIFCAVATLTLSTIALVSGMRMGYSEWASCFLIALHVGMVILYTVLTAAAVLYVLYTLLDGEEKEVTTTTTTEAAAAGR